MKNNIVVYDVETRNMPEDVGGWKNCFEMGIATCVLYSYDDNLYHFFGDTEKEHIRLLEFINGKIAVTFNGINFDSKVLLGNDREILPNGTTIGSPFGTEISFKNYDMNAEIWKSIFETDDVVSALEQQSKAKQFHVKGVWNLDSIVINTLGNTIKKTSNGASAPQKYKDGKIMSLFEYNVQDVRTERFLFEFCKKYKYIVNGNYDIIKLR